MRERKHLNNYSYVLPMLVVLFIVWPVSVGVTELMVSARANALTMRSKCRRWR